MYFFTSKVSDDLPGSAKIGDAGVGGDARPAHDDDILGGLEAADQILGGEGARRLGASTSHIISCGGAAG